ncbi:hypothetical protein C8Q70DRAFT_72312 [Cubamyces menziesii]|nr:hypothetical protein C8Q70DRAFT_72312 [Cubamyces menziesii]
MPLSRQRVWEGRRIPVCSETARTVADTNIDLLSWMYSGSEFRNGYTHLDNQLRGASMNACRQPMLGNKPYLDPDPRWVILLRQLNPLAPRLSVLDHPAIDPAVPAASSQRSTGTQKPAEESGSPCPALLLTSKATASERQHLRSQSADDGYGIDVHDRTEQQHKGSTSSILFHSHASHLHPR